MIFNDKGLQLLKSFEGCSLVAYQDQGGVWTIGYGHTGDIKADETVTEEAASNTLMDDVLKTEKRVTDLLAHDLNNNQYSAIVCFAFNVGCGNLAKSTLLNCINTGHIDDAANEFTRWDKVAGVQNDGLLRRRKAERDLFLSI